jgi:hypothetical protein
MLSIEQIPAAHLSSGCEMCRFNELLEHVPSPDLSNNFNLLFRENEGLSWQEDLALKAKLKDHDLLELYQTLKSIFNRQIYSANEMADFSVTIINHLKIELGRRFSRQLEERIRSELRETFGQINRQINETKWINSLVDDIRQSLDIRKIWCIAIGSAKLNPAKWSNTKAKWLKNYADNTDINRWLYNCIKDHFDKIPPPPPLILSPEYTYSSEDSATPLDETMTIRETLVDKPLTTSSSYAPGMYYMVTLGGVL